jgi:hypothetical protein
MKGGRLEVSGGRDARNENGATRETNNTDPTAKRTRRKMITSTGGIAKRRIEESVLGTLMNHHT